MHEFIIVFQTGERETFLADALSVEEDYLFKIGGKTVGAVPRHSVRSVLKTPGPATP